jgi:hypothetical protein
MPNLNYYNTSFSLSRLQALAAYRYCKKNRFSLSGWVRSLVVRELISLGNLSSDVPSPSAYSGCKRPRLTRKRTPRPHIDFPPEKTSKPLQAARLRDLAEQRKQTGA